MVGEKMGQKPVDEDDPRGESIVRPRHGPVFYFDDFVRRYGICSSRFSETFGLIFF